MRVVPPVVTDWLTKLERSPLNDHPRRGKVALIGNSMLGPERPPLEDPTWDIWGCNSLWKRCLDKQNRFRADAWFELHPLSVQTPQELEDMHNCPVPLYVLDIEPRPKGLTDHWRCFPIDLIRDQFGHRDYFTCTMCFQIALAIQLGYRTLGIFGMELWQGSSRERLIELPAMLYWMGLAKGAGMEIVLPGYSKLASFPLLYGYHYHQEDKMAQSMVYEFVYWWSRDRAKQKRKDLRPKFKVVKK